MHREIALAHLRIYKPQKRKTTKKTPCFELFFQAPLPRRFEAGGTGLRIIAPVRPARDAPENCVGAYFNSTIFFTCV